MCTRNGSVGAEESMKTLVRAWERHLIALVAAACAAVLLPACAGVSQRTPSAAAPAARPSTGTTPPVTALPAPNDYARPEAWLCRPGRQDACAVDLTTTVITADGKLQREEWKPNPDARIDCFYVYPTVSRDATTNSDMEPGPEERWAVEMQFARFGSECRLFAPVYRQVTLAGLIAAMKEKRFPDWTGAYRDVADAWNHYLQHDNGGRGVVLIGHSQGARMVARLLREEIEGKPVQRRLVSALVIGGSFPLPPQGSGDAQRLRPCTAPTQTGCVISYASYRSSSPPPANALFGRGPEGAPVACTNPAALGGGSGKLEPYFPVGRLLTGPPQPYSWLSTPTPIATPVVHVPEMLTGECISKDGFAYLAVTVHGDPAGARTNDIPGDVVYQGTLLPTWGLHQVDVNLAMGNLLAIVRQQARAYLGRSDR